MITVNEEERPYPEPMTVHELLVELDPRLPLVAVRINTVHIPRAEWQQRSIQDGDEIVVLPVFAGG